jgi:acyl-CoA thioester hydrolase
MRDYPFEVRFPLHWGEMDVLGHANHARFFTWFETARVALLGRIGVRVDSPRGVGPILANASCDYLRPVVYPAELVVGVRVARVGNTSFELEYGVARADAIDELCARGRTVIVLIQYETAQKVRIPVEVRAAIASLGAGMTG